MSVGSPSVAPIINIASAFDEFLQRFLDVLKGAHHATEDCQGFIFDGGESPSLKGLLRGLKAGQVGLVGIFHNGSDILGHRLPPLTNSVQIPMDDKMRVAAHHEFLDFHSTCCHFVLQSEVGLTGDMFDPAIPTTILTTVIKNTI